MNIQFLKGEENFSLGELVELGRRLTNEQLKQMDLLESVIKSEQEYLWRLRSIADLAREFSGKISTEIGNELLMAEKFSIDPKRDGSYYIGRSIFSEKRSLPAPGTLIIRECRYQRPWPEKIKPDGSKRKTPSETFRFVVVDTPSSLLRLGDERGVIYLSVSSAASAATGSSTDGWRFFEIF